MNDLLPDVFTSLTKFHTIESHFLILRSIQSDIPVDALRRRFPSSHLIGTAARYLLIRNGIIIRDRLIDFIHSEAEFSARVKRVMYFIFMLRDERCRNFICNELSTPEGRWKTKVFKFRHTSYFPGAGGHKAFTNFRRWSIEAGILSESDYSVNMGDIADWFPVALEIAAQHLTSESRQRLIASPHGFLIRNRLNALLDRTPEQLAGFALGGSYEEATDLLPDVTSNIGSARSVGAFKAWKRDRPTRFPRELKVGTADPVAFERANYQHWLLEKLMAEALSLSGAKITSTQLVDMLAEGQSTTVLFEMKSCTTVSMRAQIRRAVSQLFEYKFVYRQKLPKTTHLCVVIERGPSGRSQWLLEYLEFLEIGVIWKGDTDERFNCSMRAFRVLKALGCESSFTVRKG